MASQLFTRLTTYADYRCQGLLYDFIHPDFEVKSNANAEELKPLGNAVGAAFAWLGKGGCEEDWKNAEEQLIQLDK